MGQVILALGSAGAFTAAVEMIKAFVARDQGRSVKLSWHQGGHRYPLSRRGEGLRTRGWRAVRRARVRLRPGTLIRPTSAGT